MILQGTKIVGEQCGGIDYLNWAHLRMDIWDGPIMDSDTGPRICPNQTKITSISPNLNSPKSRTPRLNPDAQVFVSAGGLLKGGFSRRETRIF